MVHINCYHLITYPLIQQNLGGMHPTGGEGWGAKGVKGGWQGGGKMCLRVGEKRLPPPSCDNDA